MLCLVAQSCPTLYNPRLPCPWGFYRQEYWSGLLCPPPGDLPNPVIEPKSPALQMDSLPVESPGKPRDTGMGSLSLLQGIFPTQGSNPSLPHCRQMLYWATREAQWPVAMPNLAFWDFFIMKYIWLSFQMLLLYRRDYQLSWVWSLKVYQSIKI